MGWRQTETLEGENIEEAAWRRYISGEGRRGKGRGAAK